MPPLFSVTLALYAFAFALYFAYVLRATMKPDTRIARWARIGLVIAFVAHAIDIAWLCTHGHSPGTSTSESLSFASWVMCGAYLVASTRFNIPVIGVLIVPVTMVMSLVARMVPTSSHRQGDLSALGVAHIMTASLGLAAFAVASGAAVVYLVEERRLKRFKAIRRVGISLQTLDRLGGLCIIFGFPIYTVAVVTGAVWTLRTAENLFTAQYMTAALAWTLYAGLLVARVTIGLRGRMAALVTLAGFSTALMVLGSYVVRGAQGG